MIISRTPYRISFFGGGTDYPEWYRIHGGEVLSTSINKYCYLTVRYLPPFHEHRFRVVYSKIENCHLPEEIQHPSVRATICHLGIQRGLEIHHDGDLPARSGMGSSSAFTVGLLNALHALEGRIAGKKELAQESLHIEQDVLREVVGSQDQVAAAYGGFNHIQFSEEDHFTVTPALLGRDRLRELNEHIMLFYTGIKRTAASVASGYVGNLTKQETLLRKMQSFVPEAIRILNGSHCTHEFGMLLDEAWQLKRSLGAGVSNPEVDQMYNDARQAGALGGKLTGAGGGGFLLLFVPKDQQPQVRQRLNKLIEVPIEFEFSGSQIIFVDPQETYPNLDQKRIGEPRPVFRELSDAERERQKVFP